MKSKKIFLTWLITLCVMVNLSFAVFASENNVSDSTNAETALEKSGGSGSGSGGDGKEEPLDIASITPRLDGSKIPLDSNIVIEFTKNVAYVAIRDENLKAFTLWMGDSQVDADISMVDDQLEPDKRNFVTITPIEPLKEGTVDHKKKSQPII